MQDGATRASPLPTGTYLTEETMAKKIANRVIDMVSVGLRDQLSLGSDPVNRVVHGTDNEPPYGPRPPKISGKTNLDVG